MAVVRQAQTRLVQGIQDARMDGVSQVRISALSELSPALQGLGQSLTEEMNRVKGQFGRMHCGVDEGKKEAGSGERRTVSGRREAKTLQEALPQVRELVAQVGDATGTVAIRTSPLGEEGEELGESDKETM